MKFATAILAVAAAAVASVSAATRDCTAAESSAAFVSLASLLSGPYLTPCAESSGYDMINAKSLPTDAQYVKMCALDSCKGLIQAVIAKNPPDCLLLIPTSQAKLNVYELSNNFDNECKRVGGGGATPAPVTTAPTPTATTKAPTPDTPTTAPTPAATTKAPTPGTPTTAPTPTKVAC